MHWCIVLLPRIRWSCFSCHWLCIPPLISLNQKRLLRETSLCFCSIARVEDENENAESVRNKVSFEGCCLKSKKVVVLRPIMVSCCCFWHYYICRQKDMTFFHLNCLRHRSLAFWNPSKLSLLLRNRIKEMRELCGLLEKIMFPFCWK